jgi:hypothetical protein
MVHIHFDNYITGPHFVTVHVNNFSGVAGLLGRANTADRYASARHRISAGPNRET